MEQKILAWLLADHTVTLTNVQWVLIFAIFVILVGVNAAR